MGRREEAVGAAVEHGAEFLRGETDGSKSKQQSTAERTAGGTEA